MYIYEFPELTNQSAVVSVTQFSRFPGFWCNKPCLKYRDIHPSISGPPITPRDDVNGPTMERKRFASLASSQFRLRDLLRITGFNLDSDSDTTPADTQYYYTVHKNADPNPLFTSSKAFRVQDRFPPLNTHQSTTTRPTTTTTLWPEIRKDFEQDSPRHSIAIRVWQSSVPRTGETKEENKNILLVCYGIHFNGLVPYSDHLRSRLKDNALVFHTRSGYSFVAPSSLDWDCGRLSPAASDSNAEVAQVALDELSSSSDHTEALFHKYKCLAVATATLHPCCTLDQLLRLQQGQLRLKYKRELLRSLVMEIQSKSAICCAVLDPVAPPYYNRHHHHHSHSQHAAVGSMGKTLTRLLNMEPERVDPKTLREAFELRKQIEGVGVRVRLLALERDRAKRHVEALERKRAVHCDRNVETDSSIMANYHAMSKEKEQYLHLKLALTSDLETLASNRGDWRTRKQALLHDLSDIYDVREHAGGHYTINGISLPDAEEYENTHVPATSISVALGYVAHLALVIANVLAVPLRNSIIFKGSQSQIMGQLQILNTNV